jgi:hypothetical protein
MLYVIMNVIMKRVMDVLTGCESITKPPEGAAFHCNIQDCE